MTKSNGGKKNMQHTSSLDDVIVKIEQYVLNAEKTLVTVVGYAYATDSHPVELKLLDSEYNEVRCNITFQNRGDLVQEGLVDIKNQKVGFRILFESNKIGKHFLSVKHNQETGVIQIKKPSKLGLVGKYLSALNVKNVVKAVAYLKNYGVGKFIERLQFGPKKEIDYNEWRKHFVLDKEQLEAQKEYTFAYSPKISLVVATFNTPITYLKEMIDSVMNQTYSNWELCIADGSTNDEVIHYLNHSYSDSRIKITRLDKNYGIAGNMNEAIKISTGDYIALYDHDDTLEPQTLFEFVQVLNENPNIQVIYSDEDKINEDGSTYFQPHFKPDFNIDLLCSVNYICHFFMVSKTIVNEVGLLDSAFDGAQDYDFIFRCTERAGSENIYHIPHALYHWRMHQASTAENPESKMYAFDAGTRAIQAHYDRVGIHATVEKGKFLGIYRTHYILDSHPKVSIIIPNKDHIDDLSRCINSIVNHATYDNYEIIVVENNSTEQSTFEYYKEIQTQYDCVKVIMWKDEFNYSAINNYGVQHADGDYILLLNNDTEVISPDFIEEMLGYCMRQDVGAVGARLFYEDDTIQHAGVIIGIGGIAGHCFIGRPKNHYGYFNRILCAQDYSAVTAACMMVDRKIFEEVHGLNEDFKVAFNDIDLCMKIREKGYLVVYTPFAELHHYESKSRGMENTLDKIDRFNHEIELFQNRWSDILKDGDPFYNPNLSLKYPDFKLKKMSDFIEES